MCSKSSILNSPTNIVFGCIPALRIPVGGRGLLDIAAVIFSLPKGPAIAGGHAIAMQALITT